MAAKRTKKLNIRCSPDLLAAIAIIQSISSGKPSDADIVHKAIAHYLRNRYTGADFREITELCNNL